MAVALLLGAFGAATVFAMRLTIRTDIVAALASIRFPMKFLLMAAFAASSAAISIRLAQPGRTLHTPMLGVAAALLLLFVSVGIEMFATPADQWMARANGTMSAACLTNIPLLAAPCLTALLFALRHGAPSSPALSGAFAGALSGALGAMAYAASCPDDSPLFVAIWYMGAIGVVCAAGAFAGSRLLRW
jgi:hypothetical protein